MTHEVSSPGSAFQQEYRSILTESDFRLRDQQLWSLGRRLETQGQHPHAAEIYTELAHTTRDPLFSERAQAALAVLGGQGDFGRRFEFQAGEFLRQSSDPRFLAPMFLGSTVFQLARVSALGRLAAFSEASYWSRGLGSRALASCAGFVAEVPAFTLSQRLLVSSPEGLGTGLQKSALTLGALKMFSFAGQAGLRRLGGFTEGGAVSLSNLAKFCQASLPQLSALLGLMAVHRMEEGLKWRPPSDFATLFSSSLLSLLSLKAGEGVSNAVLGPRFAALQSRLAWQAEFAASARGIDSPYLRVSAAPAFALVGPAYSELDFNSKPMGPSILMSSGSGGKKDLIRDYSEEGRGYRQGPAFQTTEEAAKTARELRKEMMDEDLPPADRLQYLESLATFFPILQDRRSDFRKGLKDLKQLIRQPRLQFELPLHEPSQAVPFYGHDHLLRVRATDLYLKAIEGLPQGAEEREEFPALLRATLLEPRISGKFKSAGKNHGWESYYGEAVRHLQRTLLEYYPRALIQLRTESPEVMEGFRFLLSPELRAFWEPSSPLGSGESAEHVGLAYARLLATASFYQRELSKEAREGVDLLAPLWNPILRGDDEALLALTEAAQNDPVALDYLNRFKIQVRDPYLQDRIRMVEPTARARQSQRHQEMVEKVAKQSKFRQFSGGNGIIHVILELLGFFKH